MPKKSELQKHTLNLFEGDYEKLQSYYPDTGAGPIIRRIVRTYLKQIESGDVSAEIDVEIKV